MSLPPGFLDELRNRVPLSTVVGRKVTWDTRKSNMAKGDWWAPCPFHQEKSASFHVDDRKGFYYCFGCHAKGDALNFVKESENLSFMEAVQVLATEAGLKMPERDPRAAEKADRRTLLIEVMEEVVKFYRLQLKMAGASTARAYLAQKRNLSDAALDRWEIGWAPDRRNALIEALTAKGISQEQMIASGMVAKSDNGDLYDRFRGRIIFPIRDGRGRAISLGGRSMDPEARAKYLNGPETELFDKGRNLYNQARAREAAGKGQSLIVAEGYMDVIALSEAGFQAAVAPLGTAVTEDQLQLLWRISHEPIFSLDGDKAGIRAALRVVDLALPLLKAGKALRFAVLPPGQDPDDLIKAQGPEAMQKVLDGAQPMVNLLWARETEGKVFDSPERKAALDVIMSSAISRITDQVISTHYTNEIKQLKWALFNPDRAGRGNKQNRPWTPNPNFRGGKFLRAQFEGPPSQATRSSSLAYEAQTNDTGFFTPSGIEAYLREAVVLATLLRFPGLIYEFETALERLQPDSEDHIRLRNLLLTHGADPECRDRIANDSPGALDRLLANPHVRISPALQPRADEELAKACIEEALARLDADHALRSELADAQEDVTYLPDEGLTWRISQAAEARVSASKGPKEQKTESILAPNGVELDREELDRAKKLHDSIDFSRGGRRKG